MPIDRQNFRPKRRKFWTTNFRIIIEEHASRDVNSTIGMSEQDLDEGIRYLQDMLLELKTQRNALSARVLRLPPEIFSQVLFRLAETDPPAMTDPDRRPKLGWIAATQVCRSWRQVAMATPMLWSTLNFQQITAAWAEELLHRSLTTPLSLDVNFARISEQACGQPFSLCFAPSTFKRLREFRFASTGPGPGSAVDEGSPFQRLVGHNFRAPILEVLHISTAVGNERSVVPLDPFISEVPLLHTLSLAGCAIHWGSSLLNNLVTLSLHPSRRSRRAGADYFPSRWHVATVLQGMARLENLTLHDTILDPADADEASLPRGHIRLPSLRNLELHDTQGRFPGSGIPERARWSNFMGSFALAPTIRSKYVVGDVDASLLHFMLPLLTAVGGCANAPSILDICVKGPRKSPTYGLCHWTKPAPCEYQAISFCPSTSDDQDAADFLSRSFEGLCLDQLAELHITFDWNCAWPRALWLGLLSRAKYVVHLHVNGAAGVSSLLNALTSSSSAADESPILPELQSLYLGGIVKKDGTIYHSISKALETYLRIRHTGRGASIAELGIQNGADKLIDYFDSLNFGNLAVNMYELERG